MTYLGRSVLFTGDAEPPAIDELLGRTNRPNNDPFGKIDVYIAPHHGSSKNTIPGLGYYGKHCPKVVLCSKDAEMKVARKNGHPSTETINGYGRSMSHFDRIRHKVRFHDEGGESQSFVRYVDFPFYTTGGPFSCSELPSGDQD